MFWKGLGQKFDLLCHVFSVILPIYRLNMFQTVGSFRENVFVNEFVLTAGWTSYIILMLRIKQRMHWLV